MFLRLLFGTDAVHRGKATHKARHKLFFLSTKEVRKLHKGVISDLPLGFQINLELTLLYKMLTIKAKAWLGAQRHNNQYFC